MGVFGVMAYTVSLRREELAVRLALGATPRGLRHHVLGQAARLAAIGIVAGVLVSVWLLRSIGSMLYGVSPRDPFALSVAAAAMGTVALLAALVPAWRASTTDPMAVLRRQ